MDIHWSSTNISIRELLGFDTTALSLLHALEEYLIF